MTISAIQDFENIHSGERVFIFGNGPSLENTPLKKLNNECTIALNKISKIYDTTEWRPSYYVFHDAVHSKYNNYGIEGFVSEVSDDTMLSVKRSIDLGIPSFLSLPAEKMFNFDEKNIYYYQPETYGGDDQRHIIANDEIDEIWSDDISEYIPCFASTITVAAQIASYMGFNKVYFVGCDLYEPTIEQRSIYPEADHPLSFDFKYNSEIINLIDLMRRSDLRMKTMANAFDHKIKTIIPNWIMTQSLISDRTHFNGYNTDSERSAISLNKQMRRAHRFIRSASENRDFEVYNATVGGHLEMHERVDLENIL